MPTIAPLIMTVNGPPMKLMSALAGKSPRGRRPMTRREFRLMILPRICGGTRVCMSVIVGVLTPFCAIPRRSKARIESHNSRLSANNAKAADQSKKAVSSRRPLRFISPSEATSKAPIMMPRPEAEKSRPSSKAVRCNICLANLTKREWS